MSSAPPAPELILILEPLPAAATLLASALASASPPACVIIAPPGGLPPPDEIAETPPPAAPFRDKAARDSARTLIEACQAAAVACLLADDIEAARALGADGVHLSFGDDLTARQAYARKTLGPTATVGVLSDTTRHTAMLAGEAGADYLAFDVRPGAPPAGLDLVGWWAELFEIPAVALVGFDPDRARAAAAAGAEFLALSPPLSPPGEPAALFDEVQAIMSGLHQA